MQEKNIAYRLSRLWRDLLGSLLHLKPALPRLKARGFHPPAITQDSEITFLAIMIMIRQTFASRTLGIKPCDSQERRPIDAPNTAHKLNDTRHFRVRVSEASNTDPRLVRNQTLIQPDSRLAEVSGRVFSFKNYHCEDGCFLRFLDEFSHAKTIFCMTIAS